MDATMLVLKRIHLNFDWIEARICLLGGRWMINCPSNRGAEGRVEGEVESRSSGITEQIRKRKKESRL